MPRIAWLLVALLATGCATISYVEEDEHIRLVFGGGGQLKSTKARYERIAATEKPVVIDGQMISADAFYAFSLPNACYTENAVFSPHAVSYLGLIPSRRHTRRMAEMLPAPLERWFKGNIAYYDWLGFARVEYDQLREIWPEGACGTERVALR